jgi:hypothetical protein
VNIFPQGNKSFCSGPPHNRLIFKQNQELAIKALMAFNGIVGEKKRNSQLNLNINFYSK